MNDFRWIAIYSIPLYKMQDVARQIKKKVEKKVCLISVIFAKVEGKTRETGKKKSPAALMTTTLSV